MYDLIVQESPKLPTGVNLATLLESCGEADSAEVLQMLPGEGRVSDADLAAAGKQPTATWHHHHCCFIHLQLKTGAFKGLGVSCCCYAGHVSARAVKHHSSSCSPDHADQHACMYVQCKGCMHCCGTA